MYSTKWLLRCDNRRINLGEADCLTGGAREPARALLRPCPLPDAAAWIICLQGQGWTWQGVGGLGRNHAPDGITSTSYTLRYEGAIEPGQNANQFYFIVGSNDRSASPTPTAQLTAMAPGCNAYALSLPVPY
jgi:hypothetical protein